MVKDDRKENMRRAALNWLTRRDYGRTELERRLTARFGADGVDELMSWLEEQGFVDDARFAAMLVRSRIDRGQGEQRICHELQQRGVPQAIINEAIETAECDWFALAAVTRARRFSSPPGKNQKEKARQLRFLQYRGFTAEQCFKALEPHSEDIPEDPDEGFSGIG